MHQEIYKQARRIAKGDQDLEQNILAINFQNNQNAASRGKQLSIGEQVNFMKYRAGNLKAGTRYDFGHGQYKGSEDIYNKHLYYQGKLEIYRIHYQDNSDHAEQPENGRGELNRIIAHNDSEDDCIFALDFGKFTGFLPDSDKNILLKHLSGFSLKEIGDYLNCSTYYVQERFYRVCKRLLSFMNIEEEQN